MFHVLDDLRGQRCRAETKPSASVATPIAPMNGCGQREATWRYRRRALLWPLLAAGGTWISSARFRRESKLCNCCVHACTPGTTARAPASRPSHAAARLRASLLIIQAIHVLSSFAVCGEGTSLWRQHLSQLLASSETGV